MAKTLRFPLEMENRIQVRSVSELRENFSITKVLAYYENGKLEKWLRDWHEADLANEISKLEKNDAELAYKICNIFGVELCETDIKALKIESEKNKKIEMLKSFTNDDKYIEVIDKIAFTENDIYTLIDKGESEIYLCGDFFNIPLDKNGVSYIGINKTIVSIDSLKPISWKEKRISFTNIEFDEAYKNLLNESKIFDVSTYDDVIYYECLTGIQKGTVIRFDPNNKKADVNSLLCDANIVALAKSLNFLWILAKNPYQVIKVDFKGNIISITDIKGLNLDKKLFIKMWANDSNLYVLGEQLFGPKILYQIDSSYRVHLIKEKIYVDEINVHITEDYIFLYENNIKNKVLHLIYNDTQFVDQIYPKDASMIYASGIYNKSPAYITYRRSCPILNYLDLVNNSWKEKTIDVDDLYYLEERIANKVDYSIKSFMFVSSDTMLIVATNYSREHRLYMLTVNDYKLTNLFTLKDDSFKLIYGTNKHAYIYLSDPINDKQQLVQIDVLTGMRKIIEDQSIMFAKYVI